MEKHPEAEWHARPVHDDSMLEWEAIINGAEGTPYKGMRLRLVMTFPRTYPMKPPEVGFSSCCPHPNVGESGAICLDILKDDAWSPVYTVRTIILSIMALLSAPNLDDPLDGEAASAWRDGTANDYVRSICR